MRVSRYAFDQVAHDVVVLQLNYPLSDTLGLCVPKTLSELMK
jgi:hypothetical protein